MQHIVRTNSFFWAEPLQSLNEDTVVDNGGFIIASKTWSLFEDPRTTWVPNVITRDSFESSGISVNGRVYWMRSMCECVQNWVDMHVLEPHMIPVYVQLIHMLFRGGYAWSLDYHFPTLYIPLVSVNGLQSANIMSFVTQFPSDPHIEEIIVGSESVTATNLTSESSVFSDIMVTFAWENLNDDDVIDVDADFGDVLAWE